MIKKNENEMIKKIIGEAIGKDISLIKSEYKRKNKKRKNGFIFENQEKNSEKKLEIINEPATQYIEFNKLFKRTISLTNYQKKDINKWNNRDFVNYAYNFYRKRYKKDWKLRFPAATLSMERIRTKLSALFGTDNNIIVRDYIQYSFEQGYIDKFIEKYKKFYFNQLLYNYLLESFYLNYNIEYSENKEKQKKQELSFNQLILSDKEIEESFLLSEETLLFDFGVVITVNWFILKKNLQEEEAISKVYNIYKNIYNKGLFEVIKISTEKWSPYPDWFLFKKR